MDFSVARIIIGPRLYIIEQRHETVVHVQLLVTVEEGQPWIVSNKVYLSFLVSASSKDLRTVSKVVLPFCEPASFLPNSIQPSLKPSSIRMRGTGFFIPSALKSVSHDS